MSQLLEQKQEDCERKEREPQNLIIDLAKHAKRLNEQNSEDRIEQGKEIIQSIEKIN